MHSNLPLPWILNISKIEMRVKGFLWNRRFVYNIEHGYFFYACMWHVCIHTPIKTRGIWQVFCYIALCLIPLTWSLSPTLTLKFSPMLADQRAHRTPLSLPCLQCWGYRHIHHTHVYVGAEDLNSDP